MPYMGMLKQSTQVTKTILMVDSSDHVTGKTGLTITKYLTKDGGTPTSATMTTSELDSTNAKGIYSLVFTTTHTNTLGDFQLHLSGTGADPADYWWTVVARMNDDLAYPATSGRSMVVDANGLVDANAVKVGPTGAGTAQTARDIGASVLLSNGTGTGQISLSSGAVLLQATQTGVTIPTVTTVSGSVGSVTTVNDKTGYSLSSAGVQAIWDALTSALTTVNSIGKRLVDYLTGDIFARIGAPVGASISADIAGVQSDTNDIQTRIPAALVSGRIDASVGAMAANTLTASALATDAVAEISDGIWDEATSGHTTAGTTGKALIDAGAAGTPPTVAEIADGVWDEAISGHLTAGSTGNALNAAGSAGDPWATAIPGAYGAGTAGKILGDNINATISSRATQTSVDTIDDLIDTEVAALTSELAKVPKSDSTVTWNATALASINTQADTALSDVGLTSTITGRIDAAISTRLASASYTAPDNASVTAILEDTGTTIPAQISALNNLSSAQAQTAATAALNAYDPPTKTEMDAAIAAGDDATLVAIAGLNNLSAAQVNAEMVDALTVDLLADSVATDGTRPTMGQAVYEMLQFLTEKSVSGTTLTVKKVDGTTSLMTFTLNDAETPSSITRAS